MSKKILINTDTEKARELVEELSPAQKYRLDEVDQKILAMMIQFEDTKPTLAEIGQSLTPSITPQSVHQRVNKPSFVRALKEYYDDFTSMIVKAQRDALRKIHKQVNSLNENISQEACKFLLGPKFVKQVDQMPVQMGQQIIISTEMAPNGALLRKVSVAQIATAETQEPEDPPKT